MLNVVVDTNVFVSGLLTAGNARRIINQFKEKRFNLILTDTLLTEIAGVLIRPKFLPMIDIEKVNNLLIILKENGLLVKPSRSVTLCRDPEDNAVLEATLSTVKIDFLVTSDKDLLVLESFENTSIIPPKTFLGILDKTR